LTDADYWDWLVLINEHMRRSVKYKNSEQTNELLGILQEGANKTIDLFFVSLVFGLIVLGLVAYLMYKALWQKRS